MKKFDFYNPESLDDALDFLNKEKSNAKLIAGGTDIVLELNDKKIEPKIIINIKNLEELKYIKEDGDLIRIGAGTTFTKIAENDLVNINGKALAHACSKIGSTQVRNVGTPAGNIVTGSACADSVSALVALDAVLVLKSKEGLREVKLEDFYNENPKQDFDGCYINLAGIKENEIMVEIYFKKTKENEFSDFRKLGRRKALAKSILTVGMVIEFDENKKAKRPRVALGAVGRHPYHVESAEDILRGKELTDDVIDECLEEISNVVLCNIGNRASCPYKKESIKGAAKEVIYSIIEQSK
jgi:carbon-monoxide dehydrogenase medium subunit/xanthine dehydrogenase FAD-binding subunit